MPPSDQPARKRRLRWFPLRPRFLPMHPLWLMLHFGSPQRMVRPSRSFSPRRARLPSSLLHSGRFVRQTLRNQIELVIVVESKESLGPPTFVPEGFGRVEILEIGEIRSIAHADAGRAAASAPIVAFAEDHAFPEPTWAAACWKRTKAHGTPSGRSS